MTGSRPPAWRVALSLFTAIPAGVGGELDDETAARAILWLPGVGLLLGGIGACVLLGAGLAGESVAKRLLGAALAVAVIAAATGGLHLDGLADTADGLGSRRQATDALAIMRRSDIGPMGVAALVLTLLVQVAALAAVPRAPFAAAALVLAEVTGRVSVVAATSSPAARPGGFGALVAGRTTGLDRALTVCVLMVAVAAACVTAGGPALAARVLAATVAGLVAGRLLQRTAERRLGGMTGDVFGAILQVSATTVLIVAALAS
ncbi:MAG TPA: adenosylcobinamide-GDP ribazoletransferase [Trebonia sp.]|nr:adenosylcobinamide-GDP ribazoletransferase [Trebonia sp.]